jgi:hypothetical protein
MNLRIQTVVILRAQSKTLSKNFDLPCHLWRGYVKNQPARASRLPHLKYSVGDGQAAQ